MSDSKVQSEQEMWFKHAADYGTIVNFADTPKMSNVEITWSDTTEI
jgi:hypothetical protein